VGGSPSNNQVCSDTCRASILPESSWMCMARFCLCNLCLSSLCHHYVIIVYPCLPVIAIIWHTGRSCLSSADAAHLSAQHIASGAWVLENEATRCNTLQHCPSRFWISDGTIKCSCSQKRNLLGRISVLKTILEEKPILALIEGCKGLTRRVQTLKVQCLAQGIVFQFTCFIDFVMSCPSC